MCALGGGKRVSTHHLGDRKNKWCWEDEQQL
jgi:hypothetical protein